MVGIGLLGHHRREKVSLERGERRIVLAVTFVQMSRVSSTCRTTCRGVCKTYTQPADSGVQM